MIEPYKEKLSTLPAIDFESFRTLAFDSLNTEEQAAPWKFIKFRGKNVISEEKELNLYFAAYALWHKGKLDFIFEQIADTVLKKKFNIIDWGCGQGTATLALCDYLALRNKLSNILGVTLIEPSKVALKRAQANIKAFLPDININPIVSYFEDVYPHQISFTSHYPNLHIFSNVLDIKEVDKDRLARLILSNNNEHILLITSPFYYDAILNIDYFENCFSKKISNTYKKENKANTQDYTYYSKVITLPKDTRIEYVTPQPLPPDKVLLEFLTSNYDQDEYELFYKPFLIGYEPNILLMRKNGGIMLFEVDCSTIEELNYQFKEYVTEKEEYEKIKTSAEEKGNRELLENFESKRENIIFFEKIKRYKNIILDMQKELSHNLESNKLYYGVVACSVYFPNCSSSEISNFISYCKSVVSAIERIEPIAKDTLTREHLDSIFRRKYISEKSKLFSDDLYEDFSKFIKPRYHLKETGIEINLSPEQKNIAFSSRTMKIKGVAGAGKTKVLAHRAISAHKRTNDSVLILTYNLTLRNYIVKRMNEIQEDFDWNFFHITNYHTLVTASYVNISKSKKKVKMAKRYNHDKKYKTILIDEGQDFEYDWYSEILENFATPDYELVIFADEKQNIYSRELDARLPRTPVVGQWNRQLNKSFRSNKELIVFLEYMQKSLFEEKYEIFINSYQGSLLENKVKYIFRQQKNCNEVASYINTFIKSNNIPIKEVCILASRRSVVARLANELETQDLRVNSLCPIGISKADKNYESQSRKKKVQFKLENDSIALSTVHSFKGLEHKYLIVLIDDYVHPPIQGASYFSDELLYTALTRAKEEILVINIGNIHFDNIFKVCPHVDLLK